MRARWLALAFALSAAGAHAQSAVPPVVNDYPTSARADYVFGCMAVNGQTQDALTRCSCSIDQIATILPYDAYVAAETVLRMRQLGGEQGALFKGTAEMREISANLRRAAASARPQDLLRLRELGRAEAGALRHTDRRDAFRLSGELHVLLAEI
jgi:hypothetical protein